MGEGRIRRSDIVFSIDQSTRDEIEHAVSEFGTAYWFAIYREITGSGKQIDRDDLKVYLALRDARVALGDMYEIIRDMEVTLHAAIKATLIREYGSNDWWREGIPENIRAECAASLERDRSPACELYCYTTLIHLKEVLDKHWRVFSRTLPPRPSSDKKRLLSGLVQLNQIRNSVMHRVRGTTPTDRDFTFVREFRDYLELEKWLQLA